LSRVIDFMGQKFERLTVLKFAGLNKDHKALWLCKCECGNETTVVGNRLRNGDIKSCGCLRTERISKQNLQHGLSGTRLFRLWWGMKRRCNDPKEQNYKYYGGRGIAVCDEWDDYKAFHDWAYENNYEDSLSIDRIDCDGNYTPDNCRWVELSAQAGNKRNNAFVAFCGETHTIAEWSRISGLNYGTLLRRSKDGSVENGTFLRPTASL
jgi:hypothetical protein